MSYLESRLVQLLVSIEREAQGLVLHPWSHRFAAPDTGYPFSGRYFVGLRKRDAAPVLAESSPAAMPSTEQHSASPEARGVRFTTSVKDFEAAMDQWPERTSCMDLSFKHVPKAALPLPLLLDCALFRLNATELSAGTAAPAAGTGTTVLHTEVHITEEEAAAQFRHAKDVINQILWVRILKQGTSALMLILVEPQGGCR
mgnify:CR=1 FL=1